MAYSTEQYAQALFDSLRESKPSQYDIVLDNFVRELQQNGDTNKYEAIITAFELLDKEERNVKDVTVTTAHELQVNAKLINELNALAGKKPEIKKQIDTDLVGGVVVKVDDTLIDASVKSQLDKFK